MLPPLLLQWVSPDDVAGPGDLAAYLWSRPAPSRAALLLRAARAALAVPEAGPDAPALCPETVRGARELAHAILSDVEEMFDYAAAAAADPRYEAPARDAVAWEPAERRDLERALACVVAYVEADSAEVRELLAMLDR